MPILKKNEISVEQWLNEWMETYGFLCEDTSLVTRANYINNQIIPSIGNYKLNKLTRLEYQKHLNSLSEKYAKTTVQTIHSIFCTAINKAVELELLRHNNFLNMKVQKDNEIEKRNYLTRDEVSTFIRTAKKGKPHHYLIVSFLLRTGLRKGELLALKWQDINFEKKLIVISKSRNDKKVKKPKTSSSFRTIPIGDKLIKDLLAYKDWQKQNKERYGEKYIDQDYVITTWSGRPLGPYGIQSTQKHY